MVAAAIPAAEISFEMFFMISSPRERPWSLLR